ncbi:iron chaperone [soil metagenome]
MATTPATIDEYIAMYPVEVRSILERIRALVQRKVPKVSEQIKYGMPAMVIEGRHTIYFAAWKKHVGVYPVHKAPSALERDLEQYRSDKDTVKFPFKKPVDWELVERLIEFLATSDSHAGAEPEGDPQA